MLVHSYKTYNSYKTEIFITASKTVPKKPIVKKEGVYFNFMLKYNGLLGTETA